MAAAAIQLLTGSRLRPALRSAREADDVARGSSLGRGWEMLLTRRIVERGRCCCCCCRLFRGRGIQQQLLLRQGSSSRQHQQQAAQQQQQLLLAVLVVLLLVLELLALRHFVSSGCRELTRKKISETFLKTSAQRTLYLCVCVSNWYNLSRLPFGSAPAHKIRQMRQNSNSYNTNNNNGSSNNCWRLLSMPPELAGKCQQQLLQVPQQLDNQQSFQNCNANT